jgi:hypothetical protein
LIGIKIYYKKIENLMKILNKNMRQQKSIYKIRAESLEVEEFIHLLTTQTIDNKTIRQQ